MGWFGNDKYDKLVDGYNILQQSYNIISKDYYKYKDLCNELMTMNKKLSIEIDELKENHINVEEFENEQFRANKSEREFELFKKDAQDAIEKLEEEVRGLQHDNKLLRDDNTELRNKLVKNDEVNALKVRLNSKDDEIQELNEKIEELIEESNKPEPKPEQELEGGRGADEPEPSDAQEDFTCKVCGHEAKTLHYLKMHVQRSKDSEHQAYMEEHF